MSTMTSEAAQVLVSDRAARLHAETIVIDGLNIDIPGREQFQRWRAGGLTAVLVTVTAWDNFRDTVSLLSRWYALLDDNADLVRPVHEPNDIRKAKAEGKTGVILGTQNGSPFEDDLRLIEVLSRLGLRVVQITYSVKNQIGDGCWERNDGGLSYFGVSVVEEMNRVGMLIDLSHVGYRTTLDAIEASKDPCSINHAGCKAVTDTRRNKTDEELKALAAKGGVFGVCIVPRFITSTPPATLEDILRHIDYAVNLIGIDHVAVGTDRGEGRSKDLLGSRLGPGFRRGSIDREYPPGYYGKSTIAFEPVTADEVLDMYAPELYSMAQMPNLTEALLQRGYSEAYVQKIWGENWLRLFGQVWRPIAG